MTLSACNDSKPTKPSCPPSQIQTQPELPPQVPTPLPTPPTPTYEIIALPDDPTPSAPAEIQEIPKEFFEVTKPDPTAPLSDIQKAKFAAIPADADPEVLLSVDATNNGQHYLSSDEKHPELFKSSIQDLGGTFIGVGTEQVYLYAGWQKANLVIALDYDSYIVELHQTLLAAWNAAENADALRVIFADKSKGQSFFKKFAADNQLNEKMTLKKYNRYRYFILSSLDKVKNMSDKTFMNDADTFNYLKTLIQNGRIIPLQGDLLADKTIQALAQILKDPEINSKVSVLYLSNTEQYWSYSQQFKQNMLALPYHDNAVILRTRAVYPQNGDYRYDLQKASVFSAWMKSNQCKDVRQMLKKYHIKKNEIPFIIDDALPSDQNIPIEESTPSLLEQTTPAPAPILTDDIILDDFDDEF